ncbi:hypothetical protein MCHIJ_30370 [Mycolicibacterium chitae]|uniref:Putative phiRv1 phage protein n=1 Tax=Mycolicibacterium chitae TaxID=1792 RepID=A0A3S4SZH2_MYCCI|nr:DUF2742 domain-containing protein [Mycolicibacterium chitae]MCV7108913.1 DUF2742 domain-containing protein [Mycolicibacterium chitae]BBZ03600.1 hypothetical protein MCHIJ_30370 [Mycolicibacterium chitae]VEG47254.1 putative phiRv1 phage protein [Mycolicibacterium chitae]
MTNHVDSQAVSFWEVHQWVEKFLATAGDFPMCGTVAWSELADDDKRKWAALLDFAQHHALRVETAQELRAETSQAVAASADWRGIAQEIQQREEIYRSRPWLRREVVRR